MLNHGAVAKPGNSNTDAVSVARDRGAPGGPAIVGAVLRFEPLGAYSVITAQAGVQQFKVKAGAGLELGAGARAWFVPEPGRYHFFHPETGEAL